MDRKTLTIRAWFSVSQTVVITILAVMLPADAIRFWQGWVFLVVFNLSVICITAYFMKEDPDLVESRLKAGPSAEKEPAQKAIMALASIFFVALILLPGFDHRYGWSHVPAWLTLLGDGLVLFGLYIAFLALRENSFAAATIRVGKEQVVISTGPYRAVRHPMYSGAILMILGVPPALGSYWDLLLSALLTATIVARLLNEEQYLKRHLDGYSDYCDRARWRLIPNLF